MSTKTWLLCKCSHCGEGIEFTSNMAGDVINCPSCNQTTKLPGEARWTFAGKLFGFSFLALALSVGAWMGARSPAERLGNAGFALFWLVVAAVLFISAMIERNRG